MTSVGRTSAIDILDTAFAHCEAGNSGVVLVEGATGCGKSSLVDAFAERADAAGAVVLTAVGSRGERTVELGVLRQLINGCQTDSLQGILANSAASTRVETMQTFSAKLRAVSLDAPVVLVVDDAHDVDDESLKYLQYTIRHTRSARILAVITGPHHGTSHNPAFTTELLRQPNFRRIRLGRLSPTDVIRVLAEWDQPVMGSVATAFHAISGGNPLLLRALLEEYGSLRASDGLSLLDFHPVVGGPFAQAVVTCLHRGGPTATAVAQGVALLGEHVSPALIADLVGLRLSPCRQGLTSLEASGLLDDLRFRHPTSRATVMDGIAPDTRTELHRHAARLLRQAGSPAAAVAAHLSAAAAGGAQWDDMPWASEVLCDAAEELLVRDCPEEAVPLLELAHAACSDEQYRNAIKIQLARISLRLNPAASEMHLSAPLEALRSDQLSAEHVRPLAQLLLVQGRISEATDALERAEAATQGRAPESADDPEAVPKSWRIAQHDLVSMLDTDVTACERLLQATKLTDATMAPLTQTLHSVIHSEQPERALPWCRALLKEADRTHSPGWSTVFAALHAKVSLRLGDLRSAYTFASRALGYLPERNGSALRYFPQALLVRTCNAMGWQTEASRYIDQLVPQRLLTTQHGLTYLHARGLHYLANNQPHAALADFLEAGRVMQHWGMDRPAFLAWRTDAAEALLRLGDRQHAERLVLQQLSMPDARLPWVQGTSLRLHAKTVAPERAAALLGRAVDELRRSGDRLETARAMADLGQVMHANGSLSKGSAIIRAAWNLAKECGAGTLCEEPLPNISIVKAVPERTEVVGDSAMTAAKLSSSEQRVATLAALGMTNREISMKLFITVSTVEQHLTSVYRKLNISRRQDLPMDMQLYSQESA